jgi:uncharacterized membrane protein YphA (DoxX/SURF4 family)
MSSRGVFDTMKSFLASNVGVLLIAGSLAILIGLFIMIFLCLNSIAGSAKNTRIMAILLGICVVILGVGLVWNGLQKLSINHQLVDGGR